MDESKHSLYDKKFKPANNRVFMLAGSDLDYPFKPMGLASHRLIISDDVRPTQWQKENLVGWEIKRISIEPHWRYLISDDTALITELDDEYNFKNLYVAKGESVSSVVEDFEKLWASSADYNINATMSPVINNLFSGSIAASSLNNWGEVIKYLAIHPRDIRSLSPVGFEHFIAELLRLEEMEVQLTGRSRDGGRDILAWSNTPAGRSLCLVECKCYAYSRKVDIRMVRSLYGVVEAERATTGMLVTTSDFTRPARVYEGKIKNRIKLINYGELIKWLKRLAN